MTAHHDVGIKSFGAYIPRRRLQRSAIAEAHAWSFPALKGLAKGEKSLCNWDEDVITMAVEAGRDALRGQKKEHVVALDLASTTAPFADLQNATIVNTALSLSDTVATSDRGGSLRAALNALSQGCRSEDNGDRLVIASEKRFGKPGSAQEMQFGSAAGALLLGESDELIARYLGSSSVSVPFIDHFRSSGDKFDYNWEERWVRDEGIANIVPRAVDELITRIGRKRSDIRHFGFSGAIPGADKHVVKQLGLTAEVLVSDLQQQVGDSGTAQPFMLLIGALERAQPGDLIVVAGFAQGTEVLAFEMLKTPPQTGRRGLAGSLAQRIPETAYLKMASFAGEIDLDWGMRAEDDPKTAFTQLYRSAEQIFAFIGGQCESCSTVQFPRLPACVNCGARNSQKAYPLLDVPAKIKTFTADWLQYTLAPPLYVGLVQFDVGARVLMEIVDIGPEGIDVGTPLEFAFRIKELDRMRHFGRYFWKGVPLR